MIEADVSYHILLGRPWIHRNYAVPSTLHQRLKAIKRKKEILILCTKAPFSQEEVHGVEATFFDDICNDPIESRPRGVTLTAHEETSDMEIDLIDQEKLVIEKVVLPNGKRIYKLRRCGEANNDLAGTRNNEIERMGALPLAPEKLEDDRKHPPARLKKVNLARKGYFHC